MNADFQTMFNDSKSESEKKLEISRKLLEGIKKKSIEYQEKFKNLEEIVQ